MNKSPLPKIFLTVLTVIALWSLVLCWMYIGCAKQLRETQMRTTWLVQQQQVFGMLVNETAQYAKQNPAMDQLLRSINAHPATNHAATAPKPTAK